MKREIDPRFGPLCIALRVELRLEVLRSAQRSLEEAYGIALRGTGMTVEELELMIAIAREWFPTITKLGRAQGRDRRRLRAAITALVTRGWVRVDRSPRRAILSLTSDGVSVVSLAVASCRIVDADVGRGTGRWSE